MFAFNAVYSEMGIQGNVLYADDFGNVVTNIDKRQFETCTSGKLLFHPVVARAVQASARSDVRTPRRLRAKRLALFNSSGCWKSRSTAVPRMRSLGFNIGDKITVLIHGEENSTAEFDPERVTEFTECF